jgi:hypothetical protein
MGITLTPTSTQSVLPVWPSTAKNAHLMSVGILAARTDSSASTGNGSTGNGSTGNGSTGGGSTANGSTEGGAGATGGFSYIERPRTNECVIRLQPSTDASNGISVSAAQGSQKPVVAPMGALASGVPPRSRPV